MKPITFSVFDFSRSVVPGRIETDSGYERVLFTALKAWGFTDKYIILSGYYGNQLYFGAFTPFYLAGLVYQMDVSVLAADTIWMPSLKKII